MNNIYKNFLLFFSSILFISLLFELGLRITGSKSHKFIPHASPKIYTFDKVLGWKTKKGEFIYENSNKISNFHFLQDGSRLSNSIIDLPKNRQKIIMVGGSFTMGHKISNNETLSYFLQENFNNFNVKNYGVGGYGTYQSYLKLREIFEKKNNIKYVIYSFIDHHEMRNIGDVTYLEGLSKMSKDLIYLPYVSLDKNKNLKEHTPIKYLTIPFSNYSVLITKIQKKIMRIKIKSKYKNRNIITKKLILKMDNLSKKNNSNFIFVNLLSKNEINDDYKNFLLKKNVNYLNCQINDFHLYTNNQLDFHPNHLANKLYSKCINKFIVEN